MTDSAKNPDNRKNLEPWDFQVFSHNPPAHIDMQTAWRESAKKLACLQGIIDTAQRPEYTIGDILQSAVELIPQALQYPDIACARVAFDGSIYLSPNFRENVQNLKMEIVLDGKSKGHVEFFYRENRPVADEGPFLEEERRFINSVTLQIAIIIGFRYAQEEKLRLHEQLRHADRLATIGQLSAGVAHELNEPLGNILGFAQLARKEPGNSIQVTGDLEKIINAALHSREVVKKLMMFARQSPPRRNMVDLNKIANESLSFLESRWRKAGVTVTKALAPDIPMMMADPSQLYQVLVNLIVNAVQAMPAGGTLTLRTSITDSNLILSVEDTGTGMSSDVIKKLFTPFFTTKDANEGTGLGLFVVHGIVTLHGGQIRVSSEVGKGSVFEIILPLDYGEEGAFGGSAE